MVQRILLHCMASLLVPALAVTSPNVRVAKVPSPYRSPHLLFDEERQVALSVARGQAQREHRCCRLMDNATATAQCANGTGVPHAEAHWGDSRKSLRPRVLLVTQATPNLARFSRYTTAVSAAWAARWGHGFLVDAKPPKNGTESRSGKINVIRRFMESPFSTDFQWLLWLDSDAIIALFDRDFLRELLAEQESFVDVLVCRSLLTFTGTSSLINSGALLVRMGSPWAAGLMSRIEEDARFRNGKSDQETLELLLREDSDVAKRVRLLQPLALNSDAGGVTREPPQQPVYHLYSHPDAVRESFFRQVWERRCVPSKRDRRKATGAMFRAMYSKAMVAYAASQDDEVNISGRPHGVPGAISFLRAATKTGFHAPMERVDALWKKLLEIQGRLAPVTAAIASQDLAQTFEQYERQGEAEVLQRHAMAINERAHDSGHPSTLNSAVILSRILESLGKDEEAVQVLKAASQRSNLQNGATHQQTLRLEAGLATRWRASGKSINEAEKELRRVVQAWELSLGVEDPNTWDVWLQLADILRDQSRFDEASGLLHRACDNYKAVPHLSRKAFECTESLSDIEEAQGRLPEAERTLRAFLASSDAAVKIQGQSFATTEALQTLRRLGAFLRRSRRFEEAEDTFKVALAAVKQNHITGSAEANAHVRLETLADVATLWQDRGLPEAGRKWKQAVDEAIKVVGQRHLLTVHARSGLMEWLQRQGRESEAEVAARQVLKVIGGGSSMQGERLRAANLLGLALQGLGRSSEAEVLLQTQFSSAKASAATRGQEKLLASLANTLGTLLLNQNRVAEAELLVTSAVTLHGLHDGKREHFGDDELPVLGNFAQMALRLGRVHEAVVYQKRMFEGLKRIGGNKETVDAQYMLAAMLVQRWRTGSGKKNDAVQGLRLLRSSCRSYAKLLGPESAQTTRCKASVAGIEQEVR